ncbi:MAG: hypothetical protein U9P12_01500 [Verrucomicrobiota bacterium]|nr:hypothetical protein [Verrucomicrobiota bacterium]
MLHARKYGFTVVEVFMVITLLAIVTGLMVVPVQRLMDAIHVRPLEEVFLSTVRKAHIQARQRNVSVVLSYQSESNRLQLCTLDGVFIEEVAVEPSPGADEDESMLELYRLLPEDPEGEESAYESEDEPAGAITFHPGGASTPFAVDFKNGGNWVRLVLDPFSSEPVLREVEGGES